MGYQTSCNRLILAIQLQRVQPIQHTVGCTETPPNPQQCASDWTWPHAVLMSAWAFGKTKLRIDMQICKSTVQQNELPQFPYACKFKLFHSRRSLPRSCTGSQHQSEDAQAAAWWSAAAAFYTVEACRSWNLDLDSQFTWRGLFYSLKMGKFLHSLNSSGLVFRPPGSIIETLKALDSIIWCETNRQKRLLAFKERNWHECWIHRFVGDHPLHIPWRHCCESAPIWTCNKVFGGRDVKIIWNHHGFPPTLVASLCSVAGWQCQKSDGKTRRFFSLRIIAVR